MPSVSEYVTGFTSVANEMSDLQRRLLQEQYHAPSRTVSTQELAKLVNVNGYQTVNSNYGRLGHLFCDATGLEAAKAKDGKIHWWTIFSTGYETPETFYWEMHLGVAQALEILGWFAATNIQPELAEEHQRIEAEGYFDAENLDDARRRVRTAIVQRQGQSEFRHNLLKACNSQCSITGCDAEPALEAAHIMPYLGRKTNHITNGLLLRADIHTLFDLHLLSVQPDSYEIIISPKLAKTSYRELIGKRLVLPKYKSAMPNRVALNKHYEVFLQKCKNNH